MRSVWKWRGHSPRLTHCLYRLNSSSLRRKPSSRDLELARKIATSNGGELETLTEPDEIMMAITYDDDGDSSITIYRNGEVYAERVLTRFRPANNLSHITI